MKTLLYFTHDLRIHDNAALSLACQSASGLACVYCIHRDWFTPGAFGLKPIESIRWQFLQETLHELNSALQAMGQRLYIFYGNPKQLLSEMITQNNIQHIITSRQFTYYETSLIADLQQQTPTIKFTSVDNYTLFNKRQFSAFDSFPETFSKFKKAVSHLVVEQELSTVTQMPPLLRLSTPVTAKHPIPPTSVKSLPIHAGEGAALLHLEQYFQSGAASTYKETRNALDGWSNSCKLSPWLACGALSVRTVVARLRSYEAQHKRNESTDWIFFELLWREYFQWYARYHKSRLFCFHGIGHYKSKPLTSFYPQRFKQWANGQTPWPIVNACMRELNETGYISNRSRQIVASCLVNELSLDWRCGAAYFEQQLIDYDPAVNWGNWQYIAGVGADPRGGRHFNLAKQTALFDPHNQYINRWLGLDEQRQTLPPVIDAVDAADWPVMPASLNSGAQDGTKLH